MSAWARNRKMAIVLGILAIIGLIVVASYYLFLYKEPTCTDGIKNGLEDGVDCGGTCKLVCPFSTSMPQVLWSRAFEISDGVYNITGIIENPNFDVKTNAVYLFQIYNDEGILIEEIFGDVEIYPNERKALFEPAVNTGFQNVGMVFLKIVDVPVWTKSEQKTNPLVIKSRLLEDADTLPKLEVVISNTGIKAERDVVVTVVLSDAEGNVKQTSRTYLEYVERDSDASVFYTWPAPFEAEIVKIDVYTDTIK